MTCLFDYWTVTNCERRTAYSSLPLSRGVSSVLFGGILFVQMNAYLRQQSQPASRLSRFNSWNRTETERADGSRAACTHCLEVASQKKTETVWHRPEILERMRRILIQLDEATYGKLRQRAFRQERSISSVVREMLEAGLERGVRWAKSKDLSQFVSVAAGRSKPWRCSPVSERHDEALAAVFDK